MAISDSYVVQYLLQATSGSRPSIHWEEREDEGYFATDRGIRIELESLASRTGAKLLLRISCGIEHVHILEPSKAGVFQQRYPNEESCHLAELMQELAAAVRQQCAERKNRSAEQLAAIRESILRRLVLSWDGSDRSME